jgi:hypothetical protein
VTPRAEDELLRGRERDLEGERVGWVELGA